MKRNSYPTLWAGALASLCSFAGCGSDGEGGGATADAGATSVPPSTTPSTDPSGKGSRRFAIGSLVTNADDTDNGFLKFLPTTELNGATVDLKTGREFGGSADVWVIGKSIYVSSGDRPAVTRYEGATESTLVEKGTVSFDNYGIELAAFWGNTFVSPTKAYMANGATELIVWNPTTMEITGEIDVPGIENRGALIPKPALADRSSVVHGGKAYLPVYWTDKDYAARTPDSAIVVIDTATDKVVNTITVPCTGLDYGTVTEDGRLFFSNWTGSVGTHLVLKTPPSCFAEIDPKTDTVKSTTNFQDVTGGHQAAAMKYVGGGKFVFTVFDEVRANSQTAVKPSELVGTSNWQLWSYDPAAKKAVPIEGVDWNSGAVYYSVVDGVVYALLPGANYANTTVYKIVDAKATKLYELAGWSLRLFGLEN